MELTASIVSAYVANNSVPVTGLPEVIASVHRALEKLGRMQAMPERVALTPPVSIKESVTPAYLISLEDGRQYKALKRHLAGRGLTPDEYRRKWNLPGDYPMVAPDYSAKRSQLAISLGLGRKGGGSAAKPKKEPGMHGRPRNAAKSTTQTSSRRLIGPNNIT